MVSREEADIFSKKEEEKGSSNPPIVSSWARLKDPRIVRVSRAFGGKDRHSKVCTVRGLRDRRVRLSVPTAIQLYDLQDRLGLNQPSKVVDWLLNVAKNEIDELPPLQIPPGNLIDHNLKSIFATSKQVEPNIVSNPWFSDTLLRNKSGGRESLDKDFFSINHQSNVQQTGSRQEFMRWDSSNLSLAQSGMHDQDEVQNYNLLPFLPTHQVLLYQPPAAAVAINSQSYFVSNTDQLEAVESETIRLSQNRIGRDFESWFHLSTSSQAPPPHDPKEHSHSNSSLPGFTQI